MAITIDLSGQPDGIYTIEDDGTPGNNTSIVRRPNGTILQTFVHPADSLTILSRPGQNVTVNLTDTMSAANFTIGSLTVPGQRPDNINMGAIVTTGTVTLTANAAISEFGSDGSTDIIAGKLFMDAGTGIGQFNAIETQVAQLEAESVTGGINLSNSGNVTIGGAGGTLDLRGLFTGSSGAIRLVNQGSIILADNDGVESVHSGGNLTFNAIGGASNISSTVNKDSFFALGDIALSAGQDIIFGLGGANFDNDVRAGGGIDIHAGRDFVIDGFSDMAADDQGFASGGGIAITAGRDILIDDATGTDASIGITPSAGTGSIVLTTGVGGTLVLSANSSAAIQGRNGGVIIHADRIQIDNDSGINVTGTGALTLTTASAGRAIVLGTATDGVVAMELSDAELDRINASNVTIGSVDAGTLSVDGAITHLNNNLFLRSGEDVVINASISSLSSLTLVAADNIFQSNGTITTGTFTATVDSPDVDPAGGTLILNSGLATTSNLLQGGADNDSLRGSAQVETLVGNAGNDTLNGLGGADTMAGGLGNDFYFVDQAGDVVVENAGEGDDRVFASASYALAAGAEVETLTTTNNDGASTIDLTGNGFANFIFGNAGINALSGGGGNDILASLAGNDSLDGGTGLDTLIGGTGNDFYYVDQATDVVTENVGEGDDRVFASASYALAAGADVETLTTNFNEGASTIDLTGNGIANFIYGNDGINALFGGGGNDTLASRAGSDVLDGGTGADTMIGATGNDFYYVDQAGDVVVENVGEGDDRVFASASYALAAGAEVETLSTTDNAGTAAIDLTGSNTANFLFGNDGTNTLRGGGGDDFLAASGGNDTLDGGTGSDNLHGGAGADTFLFTTALGVGNVDTILDFAPGTDKIALDDAVFTGLAVAALPPGAFVVGTAAQDADDRIIYDPATGKLFFDADGNGGGAAVQFAVLDTHPAITASDFVVI